MKFVKFGFVRHISLLSIYNLAHYSERNETSITDAGHRRYARRRGLLKETIMLLEDTLNPRGQSGTRSGAFSGYGHGGETRGYSSRGSASFGGGARSGGGRHP